MIVMCRYGNRFLQMSKLRSKSEALRNEKKHYAAKNQGGIFDGWAFRPVIKVKAPKVLDKTAGFRYNVNGKNSGR